MQLSREILSQLKTDKPDEHLFGLPEKVLQFGTGVLLRGLPDYFIDRANREGLFNGRIVVVKSTGNGGTDTFNQQDGMYTLLERGVADGERVDRAIINTSISRVLSAADQWEEIIACASDPNMQLIISNTTEIGIVLVESDAQTNRPVSFPGRLLAFLEERYRVFNGSEASAMVIVPAELITDNGSRLKNIVSALARMKGHDERFMNWLTNTNEFCNSLVDCIVPGKLSAKEHAAMEQQLGYKDDLMIMSEPYRLWAIETSGERAGKVLSFSEVGKGVIITPDIQKFRELKLRLLNGAHTFSCALAILSGFRTVREAMQDAGFSSFVSSLMQQEIAPLVAQNGITLQEARSFAEQVADRFRNPYIDHQWLSISAQYTSKMAMRCVPLIEKHYSVTAELPAAMALGFAAYLRFMIPANNGFHYTVQDDKAAIIDAHWRSASGKNDAVAAIMSDTRLFGIDLARYEGFVHDVQSYLAALTEKGAAEILHSGILKQIIA